MYKFKNRTLAVILAMALCLCMVSTAFATSEVCDVSSPTFNAASLTDDGIMPLDVTQLLHINYTNQMFIGTKAYDVTPDKGCNLKVLCRNDFQFSDYITVMVYNKGATIPLKTVFIDPRTPATTYDLLNNCSGGTYTIRFSSNGGNFYAIIVQTQYA